MSPSPQTDTTWMWHPSFTEERADTAGMFVHFRKTLVVDEVLPPPSSLEIDITADTRYKLYVNRELVAFGPVKGDASLWFYDRVDIGPYLRPGRNAVSVTVLRFFHATSYAKSFPRLASGGLRITASDRESPWDEHLRSGPAWETAIDLSTILRVDEPEDEFLHIYERTVRRASDEHGGLAWVPARILEYDVSTGNSAPWNLSRRMIPPSRTGQIHISALHNVHSDVPLAEWETTLVGDSEAQRQGRAQSRTGIRLTPHTTHEFDLEVPHHTTAFVYFRFTRPAGGGGTFRVRYAEAYEDTPALVPYLRRKGNRRDTSKNLLGPEDIYEFQGWRGADHLGDGDPSPDPDPDPAADDTETFAPFHFRTFRFARVRIDVGPSELVLRQIELTTVQYPLDVAARFEVSGPEDTANRLWSTSIRTLNNCMHDCYEDCPFYEQLQYAMDTRSSALFTYYVSGDDRLARQAIVQLHNSFAAGVGLTASRAPSHSTQFIPHFSIYWICMLSDHFTFFGDAAFLRGFVPVVDAVLNYFHSLVDPELCLVRLDARTGIWNFVDWAEQWRPYGIPPAAARTGVSTYTNSLYAYGLKMAAKVMWAVGRTGLAEEYMARAAQVTRAVNTHCFDGHFFTDGLAGSADEGGDYSQHNQVWAVLSGAEASPERGRAILRACLAPSSDVKAKFVPASISMSFYTLRALSEVGGGLYEELFHRFWDPWAAQLALNLTTWEEDSVSQRSDCHAWGSVPLYEFMAEVAGIRPAEPGWAGVVFQPRVGLYQELRVTVPLRRDGDRPDLLAHVSWKPTSESTTEVCLEFEGLVSEVISVIVKLPSLPARLMDSTMDLEFVVRT
ncbi:related to rhamnosidase B [Cephalotrichum gorgonifer]|uniref:Related to rhamnosidase B n=1 Tax=Cephalotrichum gorgonifer TaxID=2041049 RepID=A0AAE8MVE5_9PEZI|nr:related to rhamnosidase B [Cephalotrichum gorgonifer]